MHRLIAQTVKLVQAPARQQQSVHGPTTMPFYRPKAIGMLRKTLGNHPMMSHQPSCTECVRGLTASGLVGQCIFADHPP